jgi:hypothetical protein
MSLIVPAYASLAPDQHKQKTTLRPAYNAHRVLLQEPATFGTLSGGIYALGATLSGASFSISSFWEIQAVVRHDPTAWPGRPSMHLRRAIE